MQVHRLVLAFLLLAFSLRPVLFTQVSFSAMTRKVIKVEYLENCDQKVFPIMYNNFTFTRNGSLLVVNGEEVISRDMGHPTKVEFRIVKCKDKSNPDTCEYYNTWKWDNMCDCFALPFLKAFKDAHTPPMSCPMKKNHHYVKNARISADLVETFLAYSNTNVLWKFRITTIEGTTIVGCVDMASRLVPLRIRV